jgi:hypothetical protein
MLRDLKVPESELFGGGRFPTDALYRPAGGRGWIDHHSRTADVARRNRQASKGGATRKTRACPDTMLADQHSTQCDFPAR